MGDQQPIGRVADRAVALGGQVRVQDQASKSVDPAQRREERALRPRLRRPRSIRLIEDREPRPGERRQHQRQCPAHQRRQAKAQLVDRGQHIERRHLVSHFDAPGVDRDVLSRGGKGGKPRQQREPAQRGEGEGKLAQPVAIGDAVRADPGKPVQPPDRGARPHQHRVLDHRAGDFGGIGLCHQRNPGAGYAGLFKGDALLGGGVGAEHAGHAVAAATAQLGTERAGEGCGRPLLTIHLRRCSSWPARLETQRQNGKSRRPVPFAVRRWIGRRLELSVFTRQRVVRAAGPSPTRSPRRRSIRRRNADATQQDRRAHRPADASGPVSYTHLTLPTSDLV